MSPENLMLQLHQTLTAMKLTDAKDVSSLRADLIEKSLNVLVVVDDVWSTCFYSVVQLLTSVAPRSRILMSTRSAKVLEGRDYKQFDLNVLSPARALEFLKQQANDGWNDSWSEEDAIAIVKKTGGLVLFLSLLAKKLKKNDATLLGRMKRELEREDKTLDKRYRGVFGETYDAYGASGIDCLRLSVDMIANEALRQQYVMLGVFPVNVDVPMSVLGKLWELKDDEDEVALIVDELERESLLTRSGAGIVLHSLQHAYVRMVWKTATSLNAGPNEAHCKALDAMYEVYNERGYYMITLPCILESVKVKEALGIHLDAMSLYKLAMAYKNQGEYAKALERYEKSLAIQLKSLGPSHPHVTVTQGNIQAVKKELARSKRGT